MSENTKIEWADHSWSPWRGCTKVSTGCANCYAETLSRRNQAVMGEWGKGKPRVLSKSWNDPVKWNTYRFRCPSCGHWNHSASHVCQSESKGCLCRADSFQVCRQRVFPSLCDWLDEEVPVTWLGRFLHLIYETPNLDWLLLTKRPELFMNRMAKLMETYIPWAIFGRRWLSGEAPENVWFGVSVEDQARASERIPLLLGIPARIRWLSVEPLLGPVDLSRHAFGGFVHSPNCENEHCALAGGPEDCCGTPIPSVDWVVVGGESGPRARPCNIEWVRGIVAQCKHAGVPVFVKQLGSRAVFHTSEPGFCGIRHPKAGDPAEWPEDLRVRGFPV